MTTMAISAAASDRTDTMAALVRRRYGTPDVVAFEEVARPELPDDAVLVRVRASSINRADWYSVAGKPVVGRAMMGLLKPKDPLLGGDFAGIVEAAGKDVTELAPGDEVFGVRSGAWAKYVASKQAVVRKPANLTPEEAAAVPIAALTALQGLRDHGGVQPGQKVLVNGAG